MGFFQEVLVDVVRIGVQSVFKTIVTKPSKKWPGFIPVNKDGKTPNKTFGVNKAPHPDTKPGPKK